MNSAGATSAAALSAANNMLNRGTLAIYSGTMPTTPETALSGNTSLVSWTFGSPAFPATGATVSSSNVSVAANTMTGGSPGASGTASFARATVWPWATGQSVTQGAYAVNASNLYVNNGVAATTGATAPTGTTTSSDGTVTWTYVSATNTAAGHVVADYTVGTSGTDIVLGTTSINTGTTVTMSSFTHKMPAV